MVFPKVSILIAVRNEEAVIIRCLTALEELAYPRACLQILIGDDASTDNTPVLLREATAGKAHIEVLLITEQVGKQAGKGNVLAQLAQKATGEFLFITDADVAVSPDWITAALAHFDTPQVGVVSNFTWIESKSVFEVCQALEWTQALATFAAFSQYKIPITAQGNNMAIRHDAYNATGGYEQMPFSVTEDFALFWEIIKKGYTFKNIIAQQGIVTSLPTPTWRGVLEQRRRWLVGALGLHWSWKIALWCRAFMLPFLIILAWSLPTLVSVVAILGILYSYFTLFFALRKVGKLHYLIYFLPFVCYQEIILMGTVFYYWRHKHVRWKGRDF